MHEVSNKTENGRNGNGLADLVAWIAECGTQNYKDDADAIYDGEQAFAEWPFRNERMIDGARDEARRLGFLVEATSTGWIGLLPLTDLWNAESVVVPGACLIASLDVRQEEGIEITCFHSVENLWEPEDSLLECYGWSVAVDERKNEIVARYDYIGIRHGLQ